MKKNNIKHELYITGGALYLLIASSFSTETQIYREIMAIVCFICAIIMFIGAYKESKKIE